LTPQGDCIVAVGCDFTSEQMHMVCKWRRARAVMSVDGVHDSVSFDVNGDFDSDEIVIRMSDFLSERTLGVRADKGAGQLDRKFVSLLQDGKEVRITLEEETIAEK